MTKEEEDRAHRLYVVELVRKWHSGKFESSLGLGLVRVYETTVNGFDLLIEPDRYRGPKKGWVTEFRWKARLASGQWKPWSAMCPTLSFAKRQAEQWAAQQKRT